MHSLFIHLLFFAVYGCGRTIYVIDEYTIKEYFVFSRSKNISAHNFDFIGETNAQIIDLISVEQCHFSVAQQLKNDEYERFMASVTFYIVLMFMVALDIVILTYICYVSDMFFMKYKS